MLPPDFLENIESQAIKQKELQMLDMLILL